MRKIILFIACSLDGFIARKDGGIDWLFTDQDYGYKEFYESVDTLLVGRKTYELACSFPEWPYAEKKTVVFTKNKNQKTNSRIEFSSDPIPFTKKLLKENGKNVWIVGGGEIISIFLNAEMVDELRVFVHPVILGDGIPLFTKIKKQIKLKLINEQKFSTGLVELHYRVEKD